MKESSREVLPTDLQRELNKLSPNVTLNSDGSFSVSNMPALFYSPGLRPAAWKRGAALGSLVMTVKCGRLLASLRIGIRMIFPSPLRS